MRIRLHPTAAAVVLAVFMTVLTVAGAHALDLNPAALRTKSYLLPTAGAEGGSPIAADASYQMSLRPTGPDRDWTSVRIGVISYDDAFTVRRMNVGVTGTRNLNAITGDFSTGFVQAISADTTIAAGTGDSPVITWLGSWNAASDASNRLLRIQIQVAAGAVLGNWGGGQPGPKGIGLGWVMSGNEAMTTNLTSGFSTAGGTSFGSMPQLIVEFSGHSMPVIPLLCVGDSTLWGYGDGDQYNQPFGVPGRLAERWRAAGVAIAPVNFARVGHRTDQFNRRLEAILATCDFGACLLQFGSVNNISQSRPYAQMRTDWIEAEGILAAESIPVVPWLSCGMNSAAAGWWTSFKAEQDWMIARNPLTVAAYRTRVTNMSNGYFNAGMAFSDGGHPSDAGYNAWEEDGHAAILAALTDGSSPPVNAAPSVNAGTDQTITLPATATLSGSATDDGLPTGSTLSYQWTKSSGPGTVTFTSATSASTTASFSAAGTYVLQLAASDTALSGTDTLTITVNPVVASSGTYGNGGANWLVPASGTLRLEVENFDLGGEGVAYHDDGARQGTNASRAPETVDLEDLAGGGIDIGYIAAGEWLRYSMTVATTGLYDLRFRVSNGMGHGNAMTSAIRLSWLGSVVVNGVDVPHTGAWDSFTSTVTATGVSLTAGSGTFELLCVTDGFNIDWIEFTPAAAGVNTAPVANAGADQTITLPATATLSGSATDDGLPTGSTVTYLWTKSSGPGTVTFTAATSAGTTASFSAAGTYVLQLAASDTALTGTDTLTITVNAAPVGNTAPVANAGPDQTITLPATATLSGSATDDGQPGGSTLSYLWVKSSGPGTVTFGSATSAGTTASFSAAGVYVLQLAASDSALSGVDSVIITVQAAASGGNPIEIVSTGSGSGSCGAGGALGMLGILGLGLTWLRPRSRRR